MTSPAVIFENFAPTQAIVNSVTEKLGRVTERLLAERVKVFEVRLTMLNAPGQPGEDVYECRVHLKGRQMSEIMLRKRSHNLYKAIAAAAKALHGLVPRIRERQRVNVRKLHHRPHKWERWRGLAPAA